MHKKSLIPMFISSLLLSNLANAEIRYIPLEEAESTRKCLLFSNRLSTAEEELRLATVAGGSALGKPTAEINAIRTKLKFERDYYRRKAEIACAEEEALQKAKQEKADSASEAVVEAVVETAPEAAPETVPEAVGQDTSNSSRPAVAQDTQATATADAPL